MISTLGIIGTFGFFAVVTLLGGIYFIYFFPTALPLGIFVNEKGKKIPLFYETQYHVPLL